MSNALQPIAYTSAVTLTRKRHANTLVVMNSATGFIVTLPAATGTGDVYSIFVQTTVSSGNHVVQVANSTDVIQGGLAVSTALSSGRPVLTTTTSDTITMNGSTQGGLVGSWITLTDAAAGFFQLDGFMVSTGSEASPFSAAV